MTRISPALVLCVAVLMATNAFGDQLVGVGLYCLSIESVGPPSKPLRAGERPPHLAFRVSNRSEIVDERKTFAVAPLNDEVFRSLAALTTDARICLSASHMTIRHGLDILFAWRVDTCTDFDCTNVRGFEDLNPKSQGRKKVQTSPPPPRADPSGLETPVPEDESVEGVKSAEGVGSLD